MLEDLLEDSEHTVIFLWDEIPWMLQNIQRNCGESTAMEVLDTLRALRNTHSRLRMVFTGSIGLHHVFKDLRRSGYANAPTNDMFIREVPLLDPENAHLLVRCLFEGESIKTRNDEETVEAVASAVDGHPFYIQHVVDQLARDNVEATPNVVDEIVTAFLTDPQDPWHLCHYRDRLDKHYDESERRYALHLLDAIATSSTPLQFDGLLNLVKAQMEADADEARSVLTLLQRDHYIVQQPDGAYRFGVPIVRRSWILQRGLSQ